MLRRCRVALLLVSVLASASPALAAGESQPEVKLATTTISAFTHEDAPLRDVVQEIARLTGTNIVIDTKNVDASRTVSIELANLPAKNVLDLVLMKAGLVRQMRHGVIWITTQAAADDKPVIRTRRYDVRDLTMKIQDFPAPEVTLGDRGAAVAAPEEKEDPPTADDLIDLIQTHVSPESWDKKGFAIRVFRGQLIVSATAEVHTKIREFLAKL